MKPYTVIVLLLFLVSSDSSAQQPFLRFEHLSIKEGLSQNSVIAIGQDRLGFLWFGTQEGLNRYDGHQIKIYRKKANERSSLGGNWINVLLVDKAGHLWVGLRNSNLDRLHTDLGHFEHFEIKAPHQDSVEILSLFEDHQNNIWVGKNKGLAKIDPQNDSISHLFERELMKIDGELPRINTMFQDSQQRVWLGTNKGLAYINTTNNRFRWFSAPLLNGEINYSVTALLQNQQGFLWMGTAGAGLHRYNPELGYFEPFSSLSKYSISDYISCLYEDQFGELWIGTNKGLIKWNPLTRGVQMIRHHPGDPETLSHNRIESISPDLTGNLWIGTGGGGLNKYKPITKDFPHFKNDPSSPNSLSDNSVFAFYEDENETLWIGTDQGGLNKVEGDVYTHYQHDSTLATSISPFRIRTITKDHLGKLWIGTSGSLECFDPIKETFRHYFHNPKDATSLSHDSVRKVLEDNSKHLWIATNDGLNRYIRNEDRFQIYRHDASDPRSLSSNKVYTLYEDRLNRLWLATLGGGLNLMDRNQQFTHFKHAPSNPKSIAGNNVLCIYEDKKGSLWVGTRNGLSLLSPNHREFSHFTSRDGLANDVIYGILEDGMGHLWLSTNKGLSQFHVQSQVFRNYDVHDGLQSNEFNGNSYLKRKDGRLLFGGVNGYNQFSPQGIQHRERKAPVVFVDFLLFNESVPLNTSDKPSPLKKKIFETQELALSYDQNIFSFEFVALDYESPQKTQYAYKLEGLHSDWIHTSARKRFASFTHLSPGQYLLRVKAGPRIGDWSYEPTALKLTILPPPWQTPRAYILYVVTFGALIYWVSRIQRRKLEQERKVNKQLVQLDKMKGDFLANTTHELQTPLNGIIGLALSLKEGVAGPLPHKASHDLGMIVSSGKRLSSLVKNILDFSKIQNRKLELEKEAISSFRIAKGVLELSYPLLEDKEISLINNIPALLPPVWADPNHLQQILFNLVGNAIKFTDHGEVELCAQTTKDNLLIKVRDTGIGIPAEKLEFIFNAFEQVDASTSRLYSGTGLGLAITKDLVSLQGGQIDVQSELGKGSTFTVSLPLAKGKRVVPSTESGNLQFLPRKKTRVAQGVQQVEPSKSSFCLLIVDDEKINRAVLSNYLSEQDYQLLEAENGYETFEILKKKQVDLILLDIMMPKMSGYEVCEKLRQTYTPQELPILFLTAKNQSCDIVMGLEAGANDYLSKPIEKTELIARIGTQLEALYLHRNLERKVKERTQELALKNQKLISKNQELEILNNIAKTINQEIDFKSVIEVLIEQASTLFPHTERACFLITHPASRGYELLVCQGYNQEGLEGLSLSHQEIVHYYKTNLRRLDSGVYLAYQFKGWSPKLFAKNITPPRSQVTISIPVDDAAKGYLVLENMEDTDCFRQYDLEKITRFREHALSAVSKAKLINDLVGAQSELAESAHAAGMAEIAANILHSIGNTLNSVRVSADLLQELARNKKWYSLLQKTMDLLEVQEGRLDRFFADPQRSQKFIQVMHLIFRQTTKQSETLEKESLRLSEGIHQMINSLREQQEYSRLSRNFIQTYDLNQLIGEIIGSKSYLFKHKNFELLRELNPVGPVRLEKTKFIRIFFYILQNAAEAIEELNSNHGKILIRTSAKKDKVCCIFKDNGIGIVEKNLNRIFEQGFTTKKSHRGIGLHYCANAMKEMMGSIKIDSTGQGQGAEITLHFSPAPAGPNACQEKPVETTYTHLW